MQFLKRPNFLDVCKPSENIYKTLCQTKKYLRPLEDFSCSNPNAYDIDESRKSFPSGHSSTVFYMSLFLIFFINKMWNKRNLGLLPQFVQFLLLVLAFFTALSRVVDNKHHPTDVMAGSVLGIVNAVFTFFYLNLFFKRYNFKNKYDLIHTANQHELKMSNDVEVGRIQRGTYITKTI